MAANIFCPAPLAFSFMIHATMRPNIQAHQPPVMLSPRGMVFSGSDTLSHRAQALGRHRKRFLHNPKDHRVLCSLEHSISMMFQNSELEQKMMEVWVKPEGLMYWKVASPKYGPRPGG